MNDFLNGLVDGGAGIADQDNPVTIAVTILLLATVAASCFTAGVYDRRRGGWRRSPRTGRYPAHWRRSLDTALTHLIPALIVGWGYFALADLAQGLRDGWPTGGDDLALAGLEVFIIWMLVVEWQQRRRNRRPRARRAAGRVVDVGHRLVVHPQ